MTVVVQRSFIIRRGSFKEFEQLSREGTWPYMEARGCKIVGFFTNMHGGASNEVILNTAYASMAHWESTRDDAPVPQDADDATHALHAAYLDALRARRALTEVSSSRVFKLATEWVDYGVTEG
ncbi:MAG: NIPSNAP family protein [Anaerolineaceae bacterium]